MLNKNRKWIRLASLLIPLFLASACGTSRPRHETEGRTQPAANSSTDARASEPASFENQGVASWYGRRFRGRRTASGERFDPKGFTAAHRTLPFGSKVRVTNTRNGKSVVVTVNDRGPYSHKRVIDLSYRAAKDIGLVASGVAPVRIELL